MVFNLKLPTQQSVVASHSPNLCVCVCVCVNFQGIWNKVVHSVAKLRNESAMLKLFTDHVKGEEMYGVTVHAVMRIIESVRTSFLLPRPFVTLFPQEALFLMEHCHLSVSHDNLLNIRVHGTLFRNTL